MNEEIGKKRVAERQLTKDAKEEEYVENTVPLVAPAEELAQRRMVHMPKPFESSAPKKEPVKLFGALESIQAPTAPKFNTTGLFQSMTETSKDKKPLFPFSFGTTTNSATESKTTNDSAPTAFSFGAKNNFSFAAAVNNFATARQIPESEKAKEAIPVVAASNSAEAEIDDAEAEVSITATGTKLASVESLVTGEEEETVEAISNCSLFKLISQKEWSDVGAGEVKILSKSLTSSEKRFRIVMRDQRTKRGLLNCLLGQAFRLTSQRGDRFFAFTTYSSESSKVESYLLRFPGTEGAQCCKTFVRLIEEQSKKP